MTTRLCRPGRSETDARPCPAGPDTDARTVEPARAEPSVTLIVSPPRWAAAQRNLQDRPQVSAAVTKNGPSRPGPAPRYCSAPPPPGGAETASFGDRPDGVALLRAVRTDASPSETTSATMASTQHSAVPAAPIVISRRKTRCGCGSWCGEPAFGPGLPACDAQRMAFLAEQSVAAVSGSDAPN